MGQLCSQLTPRSRAAALRLWSFTDQADLHCEQCCSLQAKTLRTPGIYWRRTRKGSLFPTAWTVVLITSIKKTQQCWTVTTTTYKCSQGRRASLCHICNWEQSRSTCTPGPEAHKGQGPASISCKGASGAKPYPDSWALPILCTLPQVILQCFRHYKADPILRACVLPKTKQLQEAEPFSRLHSKAL